MTSLCLDFPSHGLRITTASPSQRGVGVQWVLVNVHRTWLGVSTPEILTVITVPLDEQQERGQPPVWETAAGAWSVLSW